jgi:hypothetical protein
MPRRATYFLAGVAVLLTLFCVAGVTAFWFASRSFCNEEEKGRVASSDGKYVAFVYLRHCGFAAETYAHVNVFRSDEKPHGQIISGRIVNGMVFAAYEQHIVTVDWSGPRSLTVGCPDCWSRHDGSAAVFEQRASFKDVVVTFVSTKEGSVH